MAIFCFTSNERWRKTREKEHGRTFVLARKFGAPLPPSNGNHGKFPGMDPTKLQTWKVWLLAHVQSRAAASVPVTIHCWHRFGPLLGRHGKVQVADKENAHMDDSAPFKMWAGTGQDFHCNLRPFSRFRQKKERLLLQKLTNVLVFVGTGAVLGTINFLWNFWGDGEEKKDLHACFLVYKLLDCARKHNFFGEESSSKESENLKIKN